MDKQLQRITQQIINDLKPYDPERIILFGSAIKGRIHKGSDIDVIIIKETDEPFLQRLKRVALMLSNQGPTVDVLVYTPLEFQQMTSRYNPFFRNVQREGEIIYERKTISHL